MSRELSNAAAWLVRVCDTLLLQRRERERGKMEAEIDPVFQRIGIILKTAGNTLKVPVCHFSSALFAFRFLKANHDQLKN